MEVMNRIPFLLLPLALSLTLAHGSAAAQIEKFRLPVGHGEGFGISE